MPVKQMLPQKAKITALVCSGRSRPKVSCAIPMLAGHHASSRAINTPTSMPTSAHVTVAMKNSLTMASSYVVGDAGPEAVATIEPPDRV